MIETTGVTAIGVHGRTKEERPSNPNHDDFIHAVVKVSDAVRSMFLNISNLQKRPTFVLLLNFFSMSIFL